MADILKLINSGVTGVSVMVTVEDFLRLVELAIDRTKEELLPHLVSAAKEDLLTKQQVMKKFGVCDTTLWHWRKKGYLNAVKVGRFIRYRECEVERVIKQRKD